MVSVSLRVLSIVDSRNDRVKPIKYYKTGICSNKTKTPNNGFPIIVYSREQNKKISVIVEKLSTLSRLT